MNYSKRNTKSKDRKDSSESKKNMIFTNVKSKIRRALAYISKNRKGRKNSLESKQ